MRFAGARLRRVLMVPALVGAIACEADERGAQSREIAAQSREIAAQSREIAAQSREIAAQSREIAAQSRTIAADFQQALASRLQSAMAAGGPVEAIGVCAEEAPAMAARASARSGAQVGRTALRVRNPANTPDADAAAVLEDFERRIAAGAELPLEHLEVGTDGGARYLQAIVLQPLCATCHGTELAPAVAEAITARYPDDAATGFQVGQLRGAFLIDWPAGEFSP